MGDYRLLSSISRVFVCLFGAAAIGNLVYYVYGRNIELFSVDSPIVFPALLSVLLVICIVVDWYVERKISRNEARKALSPAVKKEFLAVLLLFAGTLAYVLLLPRMHFLPCTIVYMSLVAFVLNSSAEGVSRKILKAVLAAGVLIPVLYYLFSKIFYVPLP